jgi:hypothetical protein
MEIENTYRYLKNLLLDHESSKRRADQKPVFYDNSQNFGPNISE